MTPEQTIAHLLAKHPLGRFSVYTQIQAQTLRDVTAEIFTLMDNSIREENFVDGSNVNVIYGRFWMWVIGAYEVTRTMSEYKTCFSSSLTSRVADFKAKISVLRMPFAKLQFKGCNKPINGEASIYSIDLKAKDFIFQVSDKKFTMRQIMSEFNALIVSIKSEDVLSDLRTAPKVCKLTTPHAKR